MLLKVCSCGRATERTPCPDCERRRNAQPNRKAHRTARHRKLRAQVLNRDRGVCGICHQPGADTLDYIVPLAHGGRMSDQNARAAHRSCNSRLGATVRRQAP